MGNSFRLSVAVVLVAMVVACGSNRTSDVNPPPAKQQPAAGQFNLPAPVGLAERAGSALTSSRLGSDYDAVLLPPQNVMPAGEKGLYEPTWLSASESGFDDLAYALYTFELPDYQQGRYLNNTWSIPPASGSYWVALGNMVTDSWNWFNATPGEQLIVPEMQNYINANDVLLAVVVVLGVAGHDNQYMLDQLWFTGEPPAVISVSPIQGEPGNSTIYSAEVEGTPNIWYAWDFGGGAIPNTSNEELPDVVLTLAGVYDASVTVTNILGSDTFEFELIVGIPVIETVTPTSGFSGESYVFQPTIFSAEPVTYSWNFGGSSMPNSSSEAVPMVIFGDDGFYDCSLSITNVYGTDEYDFPLTVLERNKGDWWAFGRNSQHTHQSPFIGAQTNNLIWSVTIGGKVQSSPAIDANGTVYVGNDDHNLYAINPDGSLKWTYLTDNMVRSSPAIGPDGTVYFGSGDKRLYAINPDGSLRWSYLTANWVFSSPAIGADGTVYVGSVDHNLYAINPDGSLKWSFPTELFIESSPAIGMDGTVFVGSADGKLYAINPDGSLKWSYTTGVLIGRSSPAIGDDGIVYIGNYDFKLHAINPNGTIKWSFSTGGDVSSSPAIGSDGTIYIGSSDNKLYAINPVGSLKWSYSTGDDIFSSPAIGDDGTEKWTPKTGQWEIVLLR